MDARRYYDQKRVHCRTLAEGDGVRNSHNFIKAVLISRIPVGVHILDLGCGQGGDLLKFRRRSPRSYRGIDVSHTAVRAAIERIRRNPVHFRVRFECSDFTMARPWGRAHLFDVVSCQFAVQYAFSSRETARVTLERIAGALRQGGLLLGSIPVHDSETFCPVTVRLPDDERELAEYSVQRLDMVEMCAACGLACLLWQDFDCFYDEAAAAHPELRRAMRAEARPDPRNAVFVFEKTQPPAPQNG